MPKIQANGFNMNYLRVGQGPNLIMIHGLTGNLAVWHLRIVGKVQKEFRVTTYDLRGHGHSDVPPTGYTTATMAADLESLMDGLEIERAHLVGHSFGADVALHFALLHPDRVNKVVAIEAGLAALVHMRKREEWEGWKYWRDVLTEFGFELPHLDRGQHRNGPDCGTPGVAAD